MEKRIYYKLIFVGGQNAFPFYQSIPSANGTRYYKLAVVSLASTRCWPLHIGGSQSSGKCFDVEAAISTTGVVAYASKVHEPASENVIKLYYVVDTSNCTLYISVNGYSSVAIMSYSRSSIVDTSQVDALPSGAIEVSIQ